MCLFSAFLYAKRSFLASPAMGVHAFNFSTGKAADCKFKGCLVCRVSSKDSQDYTEKVCLRTKKIKIKIIILNRLPKRIKLV